MQIENKIQDPLFVAGLVLAYDVKPGAGPEPLGREIDALVAKRSLEEFPPPAVKESIRQLLKRGGFKPTGRNKPASEYLAQAAREGRFPRINNLVDINNLLSLEIGLPISLLDLDAFDGQAVIRQAQPGEKYIFNAAGQEIDLGGLICICGKSAPLGNPIKDSMAGKLKDRTQSVIGIIYGSRDCEPGKRMADHVSRFAGLLQTFGGAARTEIPL